MADHKDPADRAHLWERPRRVDEQADADRKAAEAAAAPAPPPAPEPGPVEPADLEFPRHVHKPGGVSKIVGTVDEYVTAHADGWSDTPSPAPVEEQPPTTSFDDAQLEQLRQENADLRAQLAQAHLDLETLAALVPPAVPSGVAAAPSAPVAPAKKSWMGGGR